MKLPDFQIRKRFDGWSHGLVDAAVKRHLPDRETVIINAVKSIDRKDLAWHVDSPEFRKNVAQFVKEDVASDVAAEIDLDDLAEKIAASRSCNIDAEDVARHIDAEDVASYVDVDADTIAEKVAEDMDASDVARELDYDKLAEALVEKLKEAWA
jgi:hypothetical protein